MYNVSGDYMTIESVDIDKLSPLMIQYIDVKRRNPDTIIFFRVGDFYEMFFEDSILVSRLLELTLTSKAAGLEEKIPMCGVPQKAYLIHAKRLVDLGYKVGICEQLENPSDVKGIVKRDVVQILSKGTMLNEESLVSNDNNYIGYLLDMKYAYLICYCDVSTGQTYATVVFYNKLKVINEIKNIGIKELIVNDKIDADIKSVLIDSYQIVVNVFDDVDFAIDDSLFININKEKEFEHIKVGFTRLISYLSHTQKKDIVHLQAVELLKDEDVLKMDIYTKRNLELVENIRSKERTFSLLWLLDNTKTSIGARLLKRWIEFPSLNEDVLNKRYDIISNMLKNFIETEDIRNDLKQVYDVERLSGRVAFDTANGRDLIQLKKTLGVFPSINDKLKVLGVDLKLDDFSDLFDLMDASIYEEAPISLKEGYLIKTGYNDDLDELKEIRNNSKKYLLEMLESLKEKTGIKNLKIGYNKNFGYFIEVTNGNKGLVKEEFDFIPKQTLANCERYITLELKQLEEKILSAEDKIISLEYNLFIEIRNKVKDYIYKLQKSAYVISFVDVLQSFAFITEKNNYTRPNLIKERKVELIDSRHPVVEKVLKSDYVCNDIVFEEDNNILLITGPNMAGKSTYMRQLGVIVIMAQIGCFVPASKASLPLFDKIFTRIGASDDLVSGESTFMVEMMEANNALENCTFKSLLLFDELGRGTATYDGMAIAQAILEHLNYETEAKVIFSTHYHELTKLEKELKYLKNIHVSALEEEGKITFLHKVKPGSVDKSYGIHVASLAKLPNSLIKRAAQLLTMFENEPSNKKLEYKQIPLPLYENKSEVEPSKVEKFLENIDHLSITPMEAINIINEMKNIMDKTEKKK